MRQAYSEEARTQKLVKKFIERTKPTSRIIYFSPSRVKKMLEEGEIWVSVDYVIRRYTEMNIKNENGLYYKELK